MMKMYSHNGSYPNFIPGKIRLSNGDVRTDASSFTEAEIADAGYVEAPEQPFYEYPSKLDWDGSNWFVRDANQQEIDQKWTEIQERCLRLLAETDYKVIKAYEQGILVDSAYVAYRQQLRDIYNKLGYESPWFIQWPQKPGDQ